MTEGKVTFYVLKLFFGKIEFSNYLDQVIIISSRHDAMQRVHVTVDLSREQYNTYLVPNKNDMRLDILVSYGFESDNDIPNIDAKFSYELTMVVEDSDQTPFHGPRDTSQSVPISFSCVGKKAFKARQTFIKNKVYMDKTRKEILYDLFDGFEINTLSDIYKTSSILEQVVLPPSRQISAFYAMDHRFSLFNGASPTFILYRLDGKINMGSCVKNNSEPVKVFLGTNDIGMKNSVKIGAKKDTKYDYMINKPIKEKLFQNVVAITLGRTQSYTFFPLNTVYDRYVSTLNKFDKKLLLHNIIGYDTKICKHIQQTNFKETWYNAHNGEFVVEDKDDNKVFAEDYVSNYVNQAISINLNLEGPMVLDELMNIGQKFEVTSNENAQRYNGNYYLEASVLTFHYKEYYWVGDAEVILNSAFDVNKT